jgi:hypothetical protein
MVMIMKFLTMFLYGAFLFILTGCNINEEPLPKNEADLIESVSTQIEAFLPLYVNESFYLPTYSGVDIDWYIGDELISHRFIYQEPFLMQSVTLTAKIKTVSGSGSFDYPLIILPLDSPLNDNVIHLRSNATYDEITKDRYYNAIIDISSRINGQEEKIIDNEIAEIRARGNSTYFMPKKPFRIKFQDEVSLLGLPETTDYVLLAEYADKSLMRNMITYKFSSLLEGMEYTPKARYVEVYLNNEYIGLYLLTNQIEVSDNYLNIPLDSTQDDAGFMLELSHLFYQDGKVDGVDGFVASGIPYVIDQPRPNKDLEPRHITYIENYILDMQAMLRDQGPYEDYLDIENFIDYFIIQEVLKNVDVGWGSVYSYKRPNEPLRMGPVWDFDLAIGNADYIDYGPENWYGMREFKNYWFRLMMDVPEIREQYKLRYVEVYEMVIPLVLEAVLELGESLTPYADRNFERWQILETYVWPNPQEIVNATTYEGQVDYVYDFIRLRTNWMYHEMQTSSYQNGHFDD